MTGTVTNSLLVTVITTVVGNTRGVIVRFQHRGTMNVSVNKRVTVLSRPRTHLYPSFRTREVSTVKRRVHEFGFGVLQRVSHGTTEEER